MNSNSIFKSDSAWAKLGTVALLLGGGFAVYQLVGFGLSFRRPEAIENREAYHLRMNHALKEEKEFSRQEWIKSGKPLPPGGFDAVWEAMLKGTDMVEFQKVDIPNSVETSQGR